MKRKLKILVLAHDQFGYSVTKFKHCEYARNNFEITYVGWDYDRPRIELENVTVRLISRKSNILIRNIRLLSAFHKEIRNGYDLVFFNYVRFISLVKLLNLRTKSILYVDTLGVEKKNSKRWMRDFLLTIESYFFKHIALINAGIANKIRVGKHYVLPLGGECFSTRRKSFEHLSLLYVGTLTNRNILDTVKGFHKFIAHSERTEKVKANFVIVGGGAKNELKDIREYVRHHRLESFVTTTGFVPSDKLFPFFEQANVGISYVPITPYYQHQPPTKTFEYLISGLPVIATATEANKQIVTASVSELISDDIDSFAMALGKIQARKDDFDSDRIRNEYKKYSWENVVKDKFVPLIENIANY